MKKKKPLGAAGATDRICAVHKPSAGKPQMASKPNLPPSVAKRHTNTYNRCWLQVWSIRWTLQAFSETSPNVVTHICSSSATDSAISAYANVSEKNLNKTRMISRKWPEKKSKRRRQQQQQRKRQIDPKMAQNGPKSLPNVKINAKMSPFRSQNIPKKTKNIHRKKSRRETSGLQRASA